MWRILGKILMFLPLALPLVYAIISLFGWVGDYFNNLPTHKEAFVRERNKAKMEATKNPLEHKRSVALKAAGLSVYIAFWLVFAWFLTKQLYYDPLNIVGAIIFGGGFFFIGYMCYHVGYLSEKCIITKQLLFLRNVLIIVIAFVFAITTQYVLLPQNTFEIVCSTRCISNHSVGNDWRWDVVCNDSIIINENDKIILRAPPANLNFNFKVTEMDSLSDTAQGTLDFSTKIIKWESKSETASLIVTEDRGRYAGNTAEWEICITIRRIK